MMAGRVLLAGLVIGLVWCLIGWIFPFPEMKQPDNTEGK
jgi:hypothetical protein